MNKILTLLISLVLTGVWAQTNSKDASGKRHGLWLKKHDSGELRYKGHFEHGTPVDTFKYFFDDGSLRTLNIYRSKTGHCMSLQYGQNEVLAAQGVYKNQQKDSVWTYYNQDGKVVARETYKKGLKQGEAFKYFPNGKKAEIVNYENDAKQGPFKQFYESGKPMAKGTYIDGTLHGEITYYYSTGKPRLKGHYKKGVMHGTWYHFDDNLQVTKKEIWRNGFLQEDMKEKEDTSAVAPVPHY